MMKLTVQVQTSIEMPEILSLYAIFNLDNKSYVQNRNRVQSKIEASTDVLFWTDFPVPWLPVYEGSG